MRHKYRVGQQVRIIAEHSFYAGLVGKISEITRFNDSAVVEFSPEELARAFDYGRVRNAARVHFYFCELERVQQ